MAEIELQTTVSRTRDIVTNMVDEALVMMDLESGQYFSLDPIGSDIWARLAEPTRVADLCEQLAGAYAVEADVCRRDVLALLNDLAAQGLIAPVD